MEAFLGRSEQRRRMAEQWVPFPLVLAVFAAVAAGATGHPLAFFAVTVLLGGAQALLSVARARDAPAHEEPLGNVEARRDGVFAADDGGTIFARGELDAGWIEGPTRTVVRTRWGHHVRLACEEEEGRVALATLGLDVFGRAASFPVAGHVESRLEGRAGSVEGGSRVLRVLLPLLATLPALAAGGLAAKAARPESAGPQLAAFFLGASSLVAMVIFARLSRRDRVLVGSEMIRVDRPLRSTSHAFDAVAAVDREGPVTTLRLREGGRVALHETAGGAGVGARIQEAKAAWDAAVSDRRADVLDRGERTVEAWALHLANVARGASDYRHTALDAVDLVAVVADASAPPDRRVAAAFLLATREDGAEHRERVRIATEACADEDTRLALELAAEGELAAADDRGIVRGRLR